MLASPVSMLNTRATIVHHPSYHHHHHHHPSCHPSFTPSLLYLLQEPGSALGIREFKTNLKRIQDGLTRTKETAELRTDIEKEQEKLQLGRKKK